MIRNIFLIAVYSLSFLSVYAFQGRDNDTIYRVDPPNWWVGMQWNEVELMFYGKNIGTYKLNFKGNEVKLLSHKTYDNPNYAFIKISIPENAKPGKVMFSFFKPFKKQINYSYEIKERTDNTFKRKGLNPGDLVYLLMPDRFSNGNPENDTVKGMLENDVQRDSLKYRHGGDIQGVINHLDYFDNLGVGALWLNPVFENNQPKESYHGYAITDHYKVDPRLGTLDDYKTLVNQCHDKGIKMVKDIVHNHVGDQHYFIKDLPHEKWVHQWAEYTKTNYRATTLFDPYASEYDKKLFSDGWFDHHMPDLNQQDEHVQNFLIQSNIWWVEETKIDAYRIDTYAYPDQEFMAKWSKALKTEYPYLGLFGETWVHGTGTQSWFVDEATKQRSFNSELPSVTDFQLYYAINEALTREQGWTEGLSRIYYTLAQDYMYPNPNYLVTHLDNHDLDRVYSVLNEDMRKMKMAIAFLLTTRGTPQWYYGTEILLRGTKNPNDGVVRQDFPGGWPDDKVNKFNRENLDADEREIFDFTTILANFRKDFSVLHDGRLVHFVPKDGLYTYFRGKGNKMVMVCMNFTDKPKTVDTAPYEEAMYNFGGATNIITGEKLESLKTLELPAYGVLVLDLEPLPKEKRKIR